MREWFKARNIWGAAILNMSDEEAGRFAKALWAYTMTGNADALPGSKEGTFAIAKMTLDMDVEAANNLSATRAEAGAKGGKQKAANLANAADATAKLANANNKNKNIEKEKDILDNDNTRTREDDGQFISTDDAHRIQEEQDCVLDAAENAGFRCSPSERANLIRIYALNGLKKVLDGIESCVKHGAPNLAYLEACMKDEPKKPRASPGKIINAQAYAQRDYSGEQEEAMQRMVAMAQN